MLDITRCRCGKSAAQRTAEIFVEDDAMKLEKESWNSWHGVAVPSVMRYSLPAMNSAGESA
jgi:hypothetical protein